MNFLKLWILIFSMQAFHVSAHSNDELAFIKNDLMDLKIIDHNITGNIQKNIMMALVEEGNNHARVRLKPFEGKMIDLFFGDQGSFWGATFHSAKTAQDVKIVFKSIQAQEQSIYFEMNDEMYVAQIKAEKFENKHFYKPTYSIYKASQMSKLLLSFTFTGHACYKFSTFITTILSAIYFYF